MQVERFRLPLQLHLRLDWQTVPLAVVAAQTASNQVLPRVVAPARPRHDVIQGKVARAELLVAVLAGVLVPDQNVLARNRAHLAGNAAVLQQADHGGDGQALRRRVHAALASFLCGRHPLDEQDQGAPHRAHMDRLVAGVQDQHRAPERVDPGVLADHAAPPGQPVCSSDDRCRPPPGILARPGARGRRTARTPHSRRVCGRNDRLALRLEKAHLSPDDPISLSTSCWQSRQ